MDTQYWINQLREQGFTDEHIQIARGTNKTIKIELGWYYSPFGYDSSKSMSTVPWFVEARKPKMGYTTLTNFYIKGKNHWQYSRLFGCIGGNKFFTGEHLDDFKESNYEVYDYIKHPDFQDYQKKFCSNECIISISLEEIDQNYRKFGNFAVKCGNQDVIFMTFDKQGNVDQHININVEVAEKAIEWIHELLRH